MEMPEYRALEDSQGWEITGAKLSGALRYAAGKTGLATIKRLVLLLSHESGAELRVYGAASCVPREVKIYPARVVLTP